jgi:hypothetical protein
MMRDPSIRRLASFLTLPIGLAVCGCSDTSSGYPSLQPRPIEQLSFAEPVRVAPPVVVADPAAIARYTAMIEQAHTADRAFHRILQDEGAALARGRSAAIGSDAWGIAQQSLSRVQTARGPIQRVLADLDTARAVPPGETSPGEALAAAQAFEQVQAIDRGEADALAKLSGG